MNIFSKVGVSETKMAINARKSASFPGKGGLNQGSRLAIDGQSVEFALIIAKEILLIENILLEWLDIRSLQPNFSIMRIKFLISVLLIIASLCPATAQTTVFTYQGRLNDNGSLANGVYSFRFALYDTVTAGNQIGSALTNAPVSVTNGAFATTLDFGAGVFTGANRWLDVGVRTNGSAGAFTIISPRQQITSSPFAIQAANAGIAVAAITANTANGVASNSITTSAIQDASISSAKIATGQVLKTDNG
jgi:hypothetical protein